MIDIIPHEGDITELRIARPPINLIGVEVLKSVRAALAEANRSGQRGIILSGVPGVFSSGVDIPALLDGPRAQVREYWEQVFLLASEMAMSRQPIFAAITGHCMAAGALLAAFCDYRIIAQGPWQIGLNEVRVGVALPECFQYAVRRVVGALNAERMLVFGRLLSPEQAMDINLVDELTAQDQVVTLAHARLKELLAMPSHALVSTRAIARRDLRDVFADVDALPIDEFVDAFLEPATQQVLRHVASRIRQRVAPAVAQ
ncbi:enoyl-CoA hydratase/isomerase family protein [Pseudoduganella sp. RAF53_2]|uniref:enoyl-CoA hydratase/isomerase family protein n=1 Tax=unclassified Pseudoduganella TaxID=2637179 RepID=UPI003F9B1FAE